MRRAGVMTIAVLATTLVVQATAAAAPLSPAVDPVYKAPANLASSPPGTVLRSREVSVSAGPVPLTGSTAEGYQLAYRTNDAHDRPLVTVVTVLVPTLAPAPKGGRNLVSLQDAEDSLDPDCAPSYQLQQGSPDSANLQIESTIAASQLAQGNVVVLPDHEGPRSEYIVTGMEGHATLDGIRATERFAAAGLRGAATPVALVGYSGGAHATAAANELQPAYAPELNLAAVAAGGVPVGTIENVRYLDGSIGAGLLVALAVSLDREFPEIDVQSLLNAKGKAYAATVTSGCASSVFAAPFAHLDDYTNVPDSFAIPRVAKVIADNALGHATPTAPTFYYNGVTDELITIKAVDKLVAQYCAAGARIRYVRDPLGFEHIQGVANFGVLALSYINSRFAGDPVPNTCGPAKVQQAATAPCSAGKRRLVIHPRLPHGASARRIVVRVNGRTVRTIRHPSSSLRLDLARCPHRTVRVELAITAHRNGRTVAVRDRRDYKV